MPCLLDDFTAYQRNAAAGHQIAIAHARVHRTACIRAETPTSAALIGIEQRRITAHESGLWILPQTIDLALKFLRPPQIVVVQKGNERATCLCQSAIHGPRKALVG